jgi:uncharacterized membrane protein YraQ (UPF0718 family)
VEENTVEENAGEDIAGKENAVGQYQAAAVSQSLGIFQPTNTSISANNGCCAPAKAVAPSCCGPSPANLQASGSESKASCCEPKASCCEPKAQWDYLLWTTLSLVIALYALSFFDLPVTWLEHAAHGVFELMNTMAWGVVVGVLMVAVLAYVPREWVMAIMGTHGGFNGLLRATAAGVFLDLCSHGILMVGAKLYERGASLGQVMAFLIASPWNSFSLTIIMVALIGLKWTLIFIALSLVVAIIAGWLFDFCVAKKWLPHNPNTQNLPEGFVLWPEVTKAVKNIRFSVGGAGRFFWQGVKESRTVLRWLLVGVLIAAAIRTFVSEDLFGTYFGPTILGLAITMIAATIIEVCSEGATPIAADIFNRANAPGNSFAFLMAGVATDYTEIMVIKSTTRSWKIALFLPLLVVPQVVVLAILLNGGSH